MKPHFRRLTLAVALLSTLTLQPSSGFAQGTVFTYQGRLNDGASPASGIYDLRFAIRDSSGGPGVVAGPVTNGPYSLTAGIWALPTLIQTPGAPALHIISAAPGFARIWWTPPTPGFVLQSTDSLAPTNWVNAPSGTSNPATVPATLPARFYRLFKP